MTTVRLMGVVFLLLSAAAVAMSVCGLCGWSSGPLAGFWFLAYPGALAVAGDPYSGIGAFAHWINLAWWGIFVGIPGLYFTFRRPRR